MYYELNNNYVTIFDSNNNIIISQNYDPRTGDEIINIVQAENVAQYLLSVVDNPIDITSIDKFKLDIKNKLEYNSNLCNTIIENKFKSNIKGNGLQPYRMNRDDQDNLNGMMSLINTLLLRGTLSSNIRLFSWQNANQLECDDDWTYEQILGLVSEFASWKEVILKRQNLYKKEITNAKTDEELENINLNYGDLYAD